MRKKWQKLPSGVRLIILIAVWSVLWVMIGDRVSEFRVSQFASVAAYIVGLLSIVLLTGYSGQVSLGHGALLAVGGYAAALVMMYWQWPIWMAFIAAVVAAALVGAVLGFAAARLSGPYLAGVTLAFALGLPSLANIFTFLGGESGLVFDVGFPPARYGDEFTLNKWYFWITGFGAVVATVLAVNLTRSKYRRIWKAIRGDETAAALAGVHVARSKVLAFTISAAFAGLGGALYATTLSLVAPDAFRLDVSFLLITGAVLGGVGYVAGAYVGAVILVFLPPIIDWITHKSGIPEGFAVNIPGLLTGILLLVTIIFQPSGAVGSIHLHRQYRSGH